jgi:hypothetical protein
MPGAPGAAAPNPLVKRIFKGPPQPSIVLDTLTINRLKYENI